MMPYNEINEFERDLTGDLLIEYVDSMILADVSLEMPKFTITSEILVNQV